jgi:aspartyl-tRNA(Asn)/glutamyl-tRNA(Gln) amidotransferase subunit C
MDEETVKHVADVARIRLEGNESKVIKDETDLLFELLNTLKDAPECDSFCFCPVDMNDALRDDVPIVDDNVEEMLKSMSTYDGYVRGPKIV